MGAKGENSRLRRRVLVVVGAGSALTCVVAWFTGVLSRDLARVAGQCVAVGLATTVIVAVFASTRHRPGP